MTRLPNLIFLVDTIREETAVHEANILGIPVIALVDTNCNPDNIDFVIPANDDAIRAIKLLTSTMADAVLEGKAMRKEELDMLAIDSLATAEIEQFGEQDDDEAYLGEATLAKLRDGTLQFNADRQESAKQPVGDEEE